MPNGEFHQVSFKIISKDLQDEDPNHLFGGIACYGGDNLQFVICGCCGGVFEPEDIRVVRVFRWIDICDAIIGD